MNTIPVTLAWCHNVFQFEANIVEEVCLHDETYYRVIPYAFIKCHLWDEGDHMHDRLLSEFAELPSLIQQEVQAILEHEVLVPEVTKHGVWVYIENPLHPNT